MERIRARIAAFLALLVAFTAVFVLGTTSDVSDADAEMLLSEFEALVEDIDAFGIFLHNTMIALLMFVPGAGLAWGFLSAWSTGLVFAALETSMPELEGVSPLAVLFLTPFGLMEISAYSLAMSRSMLMTITIVRRAALSEHLRPLLLEAGIVVALLLAGGYVEFFMIEESLDVGFR